MTDIRRTLLWVVFTMSLVLLWDAWNRHTGQPSWFGPPTPRPTASAGSAPGVPASVPGGVPTATPAVPSATVPGIATPPQATATAPGGERVTVTTDLVRATIDTRGGDLVQLELRQYKDHNDPNRNVVLFDQSAERTYLARTGLATVRGVAYPNHETPMTLVAGPRELADGANELQLKLESPEMGGVKLVKTYTFTRGNYTIGVRHDIVNTSSEPVTPHLYLHLWRDGNPPPGESAFYFTFTGPAAYTEASKFQKIDFKDIEQNDADLPKPADNGWVAMVQHYFASAWVVPAPQPREFRAAKAGVNLYLVKDYGWLTVLSKPLFWLLDKLHGVLGNWGWAIVALVVLLKAAFYWLNAAAYRSMAKMKAVNPRVMEMRERYKDKPQQMQQEMMRIYREEKVNPLGGCLPILVQIPFFIALYWVLLSSVEMRNAPWIGWVHDLSVRDPYFILPILMTLSSLLQTWLAPTPPDPMQARMMWIMPLVFSGMFFVFPAGLVLYWLTNNILSIAQQWFINKRLGVLGK